MSNRFLMAVTVSSLIGGALFAEEMRGEISLWKAAAPGEQGKVFTQKVEKKKDGIERTSDVSVPTIQLFSVSGEQSNGAAVLVCPGGGYNILASEHEGSDVCKWLNKHGYTAVLLKNAPKWKIDPQRIGVLGFSAGGHLATMSLVNPERTYQIDHAIEAADCRPNFGILIYPAYLLDEKNPDQLASEVKVDQSFPPVFLAVSSDDHWASSSARFYLELQRLKTPVEMHAFARGGHGYGMTKAIGSPAGTWPELAATWMSVMTFDQKSQ